MIRRLRLALVVLSMVSIAVASCAKPPALAPDTPSSYERITGAEGSDYLLDLSSFAWEDKGMAAGASLGWIAEDSHSSDAAAATRAAEAANAIFGFLADRREELLNLSTGLLGLRTRTVGELNPYLVRGFAAALDPYQGAFVGDTTDLTGFATGSAGAESARARSVFATINTDTEAGIKFGEAANERVRLYLREYAQGVAASRPDSGGALTRAGTLAGLVAGGQQESGNDVIKAQPAQYWVNWLNYELAVALGARPSDPYLGSFFAADGTLKTPDDVSVSQLYSFSGALQSYVQREGHGDAGRNLRDYYDEAVGE